MMQVELNRIFERLAAGETVEGWGYSLHQDFESLFNSGGVQWQRRKRDSEWERTEMPDALPPGWLLH